MEWGHVMKAKVKVLINGYGVIGKRVADAVALQDDMELIGVSDIAVDYRIKMITHKGYKLFASTAEAFENAKKHGLSVEDTLENLLKRGEVDVVIDCTPAGIGAKNKPLYERYGVKAIFQGGEKHKVTGLSFVAQRNYEQALGKQFARVVSCNTTAICRVVGALHEKIGVKRARVTILRRAVDVWESGKRGIMNTVVPELKVPSHHGPDAQTVIPTLDVVTMAAKGAHNLFHLHTAMIELNTDVGREDIVKVLEEEPRVVFVKGEDEVDGLNAIFEIGRDLGRPRGDIYEIPVWLDSITLIGSNEVCLIWATPNESNVVPENIDAIRALTELEREGKVSIEKTDKSLGVVKTFY